MSTTETQADGIGPTAAGAGGDVGTPPVPVQPRKRAKKKEPPRSFTCTFQEYQQVPGVNWSSLKHLAKSPLHYRHHKAQPPGDTASMMGGRAAHTAILEPDRFPLDYAVFTGARRAGAEWEAFREAHAGRTILKVAEYQEALAIRDAVRSHRAASKLLTGGLPEQTITWDDPETGLPCKGRIDYLRQEGFVDLKSSANLDSRRFALTAHDLGYHMQLAFYARGLKALGMAEPKVWMVAVESSEPHDVAPFAVDPGVITEGDAKVGELLRLLAECQRRDKWPGRYPDESVFFLPGFAYTDPADGEDGDLGLTIGGTTEAA